MCSLWLQWEKLPWRASTVVRVSAYTLRDMGSVSYSSMKSSWLKWMHPIVGVSQHNLPRVVVPPHSFNLGVKMPLPPWAACRRVGKKCSIVLDGLSYCYCFETFTSCWNWESPLVNASLVLQWTMGYTTSNNVDFVVLSHMHSVLHMCSLYSLYCFGVQSN